MEGAQLPIAAFETLCSAKDARTEDVNLAFTDHLGKLLAIYELAALIGLDWLFYGSDLSSLRELLDLDFLRAAFVCDVQITV